MRALINKIDTVNKGAEVLHRGEGLKNWTETFNRNYILFIMTCKACQEKNIHVTSYVPAFIIEKPHKEVLALLINLAVCILVNVQCH